MPAQQKPQPASLTQVAATMRNVIKFGGIALVVLMVGRIFFGSFLAFWDATHPDPPPPPSVGFGSLPKIEFPVSDNRPSSYTLETVDGKTPFITDRAKVYFMPSVQPNIKALDRAKERALRLGYQFEPEAIDARRYRWTNTTPIISVLEMDILTGTFTINSSWALYPELLDNPTPINAQTSVNRVRSLVLNSGAVSEDFAQASSSATFVKAVGGQLQEVSVALDADFVQVDLYRPPVDGQYLGITADGTQGPVHAVITPDGTIVEMTMQLLPIVNQPEETYPLRSTTEAWQLLSNGEGYVAQKGELDTAIVRNIYLAYYEPATEQAYYQPVYVFEGDKGFIGMVEAISSKCLQPQPCEIEQ